MNSARIDAALLKPVGVLINSTLGPSHKRGEPLGLVEVADFDDDLHELAVAVGSLGKGEQLGADELQIAVAEVDP